jgi:hypothetical protein
MRSISPSPLTEPMEPPMLNALDLYLATSTASATQMVGYATAGIACIGAFIWGGGSLVDHVLVARRVSQGVR